MRSVRCILHRSALAATALALMAGAAVACGSFDEEDGARPGTDGGGTIDGAPVDDGPGGDIVAPDGSRPDASGRCGPSAPFVLSARINLQLGADAGTLRSLRVGSDDVAYVSIDRGDGKQLLSALKLENDAATPMHSLVAALNMPVDNAKNEQAAPTSDALGLFFQVDGTNASELHVSLRANTSEPFVMHAKVNMPGLPAGAEIQDPYVAGNRLYFAYEVPLETRTLASVELAKDAGAIAVPLPLTTSGDDHPVVTVDQLEIFFARSDGDNARIQHAVRTSPDAPFGTISILELGTPGVDQKPTYVTPDGCTLLFIEGDGNLIAATRKP